MAGPGDSHSGAAIDSDLFQSALVEEAATLCRGTQPGDIDDALLLNLRGRLALQHGRHALAVACLTRGVLRRPLEPAHHIALGDAYGRASQYARAERAYRRALELAPANAHLWARLARTLFAQGRLADSALAYQDLLRLDPLNAQAYAGLAHVRCAQGHLDDGVQLYEQTLALTTDHAAQVDVLAHLGRAHLARGDCAAALTVSRRGLQMQSEHAGLHVCAGEACRRLGQLEAAVECLRAALTWEPRRIDACTQLVITLEGLARHDELSNAWCALAAALESAGRLREAGTAYRQALARKPDSLRARFGLGALQQALRKPGAAVAELDAALAIEPRHAPAHLARAWSTSFAGDYESGWEEFAWCDRFGERRRRYFEQPMWDGAPLDGKTILLWADQAVGDSIQFLRYAEDVRARGGRIVLQCQWRLYPLVNHVPWAAAVVVLDTPVPPCDVHAPLTHLPRIFGTRADSIPVAVPYLSVDSSHIAEWRQRLKPGRDLLVGLVWGGWDARPNARTRFTSLDSFAPLAGTRGVRFISLQQSLPAVDLLAPPPGLEVEFYPEESRSIVDTAALVMNLDLVISVDTMLAHLAGALARPVWTLLAYAPDWRWGAASDSSPWYPTMRLFRQSRSGDWVHLLRRVRSALDVFVQRSM